MDQAQEEFARLMDELSRAHMPFGRFGPKQFPPAGLPLYELPYEYLSWFARKGFPKGRLGVLMEFVYRAKLDGAEAMFDVFRIRGRVSLRQPRQTAWEFAAGDDADPEP